MKLRVNAPLVAMLCVALLVGCGTGTEETAEPTSAPEATGTGAPEPEGTSEPEEVAETQPEATTEPEPKSIRFMLATQVWSPDTATYTSLPQALGYWDEENLEVQLDAVQGGAAAIQLIQGGDADVTISGPDSSVWIPRSQGIDMQAFYNLVPRYFSYVGVPEDSPLQSYEDLKGATIGLASLAQGSAQMTRAAARAAGLDPETDLTFVAVGTGAQAAAALLDTGDIDVWGLWDSQYALITNATGVTVRPIRHPLEEDVQFAIPMAGRQSAIEEDPEPYIRLARGVLKATIYALENPECATQIHYETYPEFKPQDVSEEVAVEQGVVIMNGRLENMDIRDRPSGGGAPLPATRQWGDVPEGAAEMYYDIIMKDSEALGPEQFDVADTYTNELVDAINDIDFDEIRAAAKECRR